MLLLNPTYSLAETASSIPASRQDRIKSDAGHFLSRDVADPTEGALKVLEDKVNDVFLLDRRKENEVLTLDCISSLISTV